MGTNMCIRFEMEKDIEKKVIVWQYTPVNINNTTCTDTIGGSNERKIWFK